MGEERGGAWECESTRSAHWIGCGHPWRAVERRTALVPLMALRDTGTNQATLRWQAVHVYSQRATHQ